MDTNEANVEQVTTGLDALAEDFDAKVAAALHTEPKPDPASLAPKDSPPAEDPPIKLKDEVRSTSWQEFEAAVLKAREVPVNTYVPPALTPRQQQQTNLEMEAGRRRVALAEKQKFVRLPGSAVPGADELKAQPTTVPVFRPGELRTGGEQLPKR